MQQNFPFSTIKASVDGKEYKAVEHIMYMGIMLSDVPNFAFIMGYTNNSWTLKADIASVYFTKVLNYMKTNHISKMMPKENPEDGIEYQAFNGGLSSGYIARAGNVVPKQGNKSPWQGGANYILDLISLTFRSLSKDSIEFSTEKKRL